jgi:protein TonB
MENHNILTPDWNSVVYEGRNELVFENRNKEYGAYIIRQRYSRSVNLALLISITFFLICLSAPVVVAWLESFKSAAPIAINKDVEINLAEPPPIDETQPPPPPVTPPPPIQESIKFTPPEVKPDEQVKDEPPPTQEDLKESNAGAVTVEGNGATELPSEVVAIDEPANDKPLLFAEQMPEFPGGEEAMMNFIQSHAKWTPMAREAEIQGTVNISFVIDKEGKVTDVKIAKDIGGGLGEEAVKAVKQMPQWKPGRQNGKAVSLIFNVPVKFKLN